MSKNINKIQISSSDDDKLQLGGNWPAKKLWRLERRVHDNFAWVRNELKQHSSHFGDIWADIDKQDANIKTIEGNVSALTEEVSATSEEVSRHNDYFAPRAWVGDVEKASNIGIGQISAEVNDDGSFELRVRDKTIVFKPGEQPQALVNLIRGEVTEGTTSMTIAGKECKIADGKFEVALGPDISFNGLFTSKPIKSISSMNCDWLKNYSCRAMFNASKLETFDAKVMPTMQLYDCSLMFANCRSIDRIDFSYFKDLWIADYMFANCRASYIDLSGVISPDTYSAKRLLDTSCRVETLILTDCALIHQLEFPSTLINIYGPIRYISAPMDFSLCSKLTVESIREVFSALDKNLNNSVRLHPEAYNRLSAEDKAIATSKGWSIIRTVSVDLID